MVSTLVCGTKGVSSNLTVTINKGVIMGTLPAGLANYLAKKGKGKKVATSPNAVAVVPAKKVKKAKAKKPVKK